MVNVAKTSDVTRNIKFFSTQKNWENKKQNLDIFKQRTCSMKLASLNVGKFPQIRSLWMTTNQSTSHWRSYSTLSLCFSSKFLVRVSLSYDYVYLGSCISCLTILSLAHLSIAMPILTVWRWPLHEQDQWRKEWHRKKNLELFSTQLSSLKCGKAGKQTGKSGLSRKPQSRMKGSQENWNVSIWISNTR